MSELHKYIKQKLNKTKKLSVLDMSDTEYLSFQ